MSVLQLLGERFPEVKDRAQGLYERDESFREICEEYQACMGAMARMEGSRPAADPVLREYKALRLRLEAEILGYLDERSQGGG